jgi:hypothetical protein
MIEWKKRRYCNFEEEKDLRAFCRKFALEAALNPSQMRSEWKPCGVYTEEPVDLKDLLVYGLLAPADQNILITEVSRSQSDTPLSVGLLWTSDQPEAT